MNIELREYVVDTEDQYLTTWTAEWSPGGSFIEVTQGQPRVTWPVEVPARVPYTLDGVEHMMLDAIRSVIQDVEFLTLQRDMKGNN